MPPLKIMPGYWRRLVEHNTMSSLALAFTIATAGRQAETRGMTWDALDLDPRLWTVPPHKIKMKREHRQPLNDAALDVLTRVRLLNRKSSLRVSRPGRFAHGIADDGEPATPDHEDAVLGARNGESHIFNVRARDDRPPARFD
jgi:integrase